MLADRTRGPGIPAVVLPRPRGRSSAGAVLELAGNAAKGVGETHIDTWHIHIAIFNDEELRALFPDVRQDDKAADDIVPPWEAAVRAAGPPGWPPGARHDVPKALCECGGGLPPHADLACADCGVELCHLARA